MKGGIRTPRTPGGTWAYRIDWGAAPGGRRRQEQVAGFASREDAEAALAEALAAQGGGDSRTVAGFLERIWLPAKRAEVERATFDQYAWAVRRHIVPDLGSERLTDLRPERLEMWLARLGRPAAGSARPPLGPTSVRLVRKILSMACGDALEMSLLGENPLGRVKAPEAPGPESVVWTAVERRRFLAAAAGHRVGAAFALVLATGLRRGQVLGLRWPDVDLEHGRLRVNTELVVESGRTRLKPADTVGRPSPIGLSPDVVKMLIEHQRGQDAERISARERWRGGDFVFMTPTGGWFAPDRLASVLDELISAAGVPRVTLRDLRRMARPPE